MTAAPSLLRPLFLLLLAPSLALAQPLPAACENLAQFGGNAVAGAETPAATQAYVAQGWSTYLSAYVEKYAQSSDPIYRSGQNAAAVWNLLMAPSPQAGAIGYGFQRDSVASGFYRWFLDQQVASGKTLVGDAPFLAPLADGPFPMDAFLASAAAEPPMVYTSAELAFSREKMAAARARTYGSENVAKLKDEAERLCAFHGGTYFASSCASGLKTLADSMAPFDIRATVYSEPDLLVAFLTEPIYANALPRLALRIAQRIRAAESGVDQGGDFFSDSLEAFASVEPDAAKAREATWNWTAIYSTRGASFGALPALLHDRQLALGLATLEASTGGGYLDQLRHAAGAPAYSLPREVRTECFYGKAYHFWMSAYFARKLRASGHSGWPSALASYLTGSLYEFGSTTVGRDPSRALTEPNGSPYVQWTKVNLYIDALGARYGSDAYDRERGRASELPDDAAPGFMADAALESALDASADSGRVDLKRWPYRTDWGRYLGWAEKIRPYALLRSVLRSN